MKAKDSYFRDVPYNGIIIAALAVFLMQITMMLYYNRSVFVFSNIESYFSLNKAADIADSPGQIFTKNLDGKKDANGFLYPVAEAVVLKIVGSSNVVMAVYMMDFLMFILILVAFYRVALGVVGREYVFLSTLVFAASAPAVTSMFSGSDITLLFLLFALNLYQAYYMVPQKKYGWSLALSALMCMSGYIGALFGACFIIYAWMKMSEKQVKKNYAAILGWTAGLFTVAASALLLYVFVETFTMDYLKNNGLLDIKTFFVDTFFKDGFLWSKLVPPFFSIFFFLGMFTGLNTEFRERQVSFTLLAGFLTLASLLAGFYSMFSARSFTYLFGAPFYMVLFLFGSRGLVDLASYLDDKKARGFSKASIIAGVMVFMILYNLVFTFTKIAELSGNIHYLTGDTKVSRFFEQK
jgi:hypothetical protein